MTENSFFPLPVSNRKLSSAVAPLTRQCSLCWVRAAVLPSAAGGSGLCPAGSHCWAEHTSAELGLLATPTAEAGLCDLLWGSAQGSKALQTLGSSVKVSTAAQTCWGAPRRAEGLADATARPLPAAFEGLWQLWKVLGRVADKPEGLLLSRGIGWTKGLTGTS